MNLTDQSVGRTILDAMESVKHNMVDGRNKSMVYSKLEEAFALVHVEKIKQQYK